MLCFVPRLGMLFVGSKHGRVIAVAMRRVYATQRLFMEPHRQLFDTAFSASLIPAAPAGGIGVDLLGLQVLRDEATGAEHESRSADGAEDEVMIPRGDRELWQICTLWSNSVIIKIAYTHAVE